MKALTELFISAVELVEAEGRDLRRWALRVGVSLSLVLAAVLLGTLGVLALLGAVFVAVKDSIGPAWALVITGVAILICSGVAWWQGHKLIK